MVWRLTTDGVNLHPGEPDICQAAGMTPVWCIQLVVTQPRKGIILLMKSGTLAASLPAAQTNLKLDQISPYYIKVMPKITVETQTRSIFFSHLLQLEAVAVKDLEIM